MTAKDQKTMLKTLKLLDNIFIMFAERYDTEEWKEAKLLILFQPINNGPSIFASMMQIYLNQALNLFEFSLNAPDAEEKLKPQRWLRRGALEACFRLLEIARTCSHDPKEILEYAIQPLFNSNLFKWLVEKLT